MNKKLLKYEFNRLRYKKITFLLPFILLLIALSGFFVGKVFYPDGNNEMYLISVYTGFIEFTYIFVIFIYINVYVSDFKDGKYYFMQQLGYKFSSCIIAKTIILFLFSIIFVNLYTILFYKFLHLENLNLLFLIMASVDLGSLFIILLALMLSLIIRKLTTATIISFALYICMNILNLRFYGLTNPCDGNSISYVTLKYLIGIDTTHDTLAPLALDYEKYKYVFIFAPVLIWCLILLIMNILLINRKKRVLVEK